MSPGKYRRAAILASAVLLSGCATFTSLTKLNQTSLVFMPPGCDKDFEYVYSGLRLDDCAITYGQRNPGDAAAQSAFYGGLIDAPFSFVADTILLPLTLTLEALD